jgi:hypothetical protein
VTTVDEVYDDWKEAVNMTASQLEAWLETDESQEVGQKSGGSGESTGHQSGRRIVEILHKKKGDLTEDDADHMKKVVGYVKRHLAQKPDKAGDELEHTRWTASLKNWGHDPVK